jgi:uncharacterized protein YcfL
MKKILTLLLLFTLVGFLSANQVIITNDYQYIVSTGKTYNFNNGNPSNNVKYDRTNKIQIQNNKVIANPLKYHYAFFWQEDNTFIGYYKTNKGLTTSGAYLGQVNTQSIPLPLNAYSFALVRYDNDYVLVDGLTIEDIFINSDNYFDNTIDWNALNNQSTNDVFVGTNLLTNGNFEVNINGWTSICGAGTLSRTTSDSFNGIGAASTLTTFNFTSLHSQAISLTSSDVVYGFGYAKVVSGNPQFHRINAGTGSANVVNIPDWQRLSFTGTNVTSFQFGQCFDNRTFNVLYDYLHLINLTSLGIASLTKTNLDNFYSLFENINDNDFVYTGYSTDFVNPTFAFDTKLLNLTDIFGAGNEPNQATIEQYYDDYLEYLDYLYVCCNIFATQTISFETIYFDDGVSTEIERLGSILIFTLIGFTLMIFGFASKRRIFNLLSIGAFIVLGFLLVDFVGFIIILFGLIFINVYYTFFGEL